MTALKHGTQTLTAPGLEALLTPPLLPLDCRIIEWERLEGTSEGHHLIQPPAKGGLPSSGCTGMHPGES